MNSYGNLACQENYNKALECLKTLRQEFVQVSVIIVMCHAHEL